VNWKLKVLIQFVLAHVPKGEQLNYVLQTLNHSHSSVKIAGRVPTLAETLSLLSKHMRLDGAVVLEIGTGWEPINPLLLHLAGAKVIYSFDHLPHVRFKLAAVTLEELERGLALISASTSIPESTLSKKTRCPQICHRLAWPIHARKHKVCSPRRCNQVRLARS
jgi:hypothetical protein